MAYTFGDIVKAARDRSAYFDRARVPDGPATRMGSDIQRDLLRKGARRAPDRFVTTTTIAISNPPQIGTAITLPANLLVQRVETDFVGSQPKPEQTRLIPVSRQYDYQQDRAVYLMNGALYMTGETPDWSNVDHLTVYYVPWAADFAGETDALALPDDAKEALVTRLAMLFAFHVNGTPFDNRNPTSPMIQLDVASFQLLADKAEAAWLTALVDQVRQSRTANRNTFSPA